MPAIALNPPSLFTKELRLQLNASTAERRLRLSSNLLQVMGFPKDTRYERRILAPGAGFELRARPEGPIKVYQRSYKHRRNNPTETVIDDHNQEFINSAIPAFAERVHLTIRHGVIVGQPVAERTFHIRKAVRDPKCPIEAFIALSSGVDAACISSVGFGMQGLLEYRPQEKRDTRDLTETGIVTALANNAFRIVINEDIYRLDYTRLRETLKDQPPVSLLVCSPQCDDLTPIKAPSLKRSHLESVESTKDMYYEVLRLVETMQPAAVFIENVPGFMTSEAGELLTLKLRRWGYHVSAGIYDARDYGGATSRKRFYGVASVFPGFTPPAPTASAPEPGRIWKMIEDQLPLCSDSSNTSSLLDSLGTPRSRLIHPDSASAPTTTKSQARHAKDSTFIRTPDGRYLFPNEEILRRLQGIPPSFVLDAVTKEIAAEQIGQSVDWSMHHAFAKAIWEHLAANKSAA